MAVNGGQPFGTFTVVRARTNTITNVVQKLSAIDSSLVGGGSTGTRADMTRFINLSATDTLYYGSGVGGVAPVLVDMVPLPPKAERIVYCHLVGDMYVTSSAASTANGLSVEMYY